MKRQIKTTKLQIKKYWYPKLKERGKFSDIPRRKFLEKDHCFACLCTDRSVDRAHIVADFDGGADKKQNLHLLCRACHYQSEEYSGERYWYWFMKQNAIHSMMYEISRHSGLSTQKMVEYFVEEKIKELFPDISLKDAECIAAAHSLCKMFVRDWRRNTDEEVFKSIYYSHTKNDPITVASRKKKK